MECLNRLDRLIPSQEPARIGYLGTISDPIPAMLAGVKLLLAGDYDEFAAPLSFLPHVLVADWVPATASLPCIEGRGRPASLSSFDCQQPQPGTIE